MTGYQICDVREDELALCAEAVRAGFGTVARDFGLTEANCPTNGAFMKAQRLLYDMERGNLLYALRADGVIAGFMQLEQKAEGRYELKNLCVIPKFRHQGFGKALLDFAKDKVKLLGGTKISIGIIEENTVLKLWYKDQGFIHTGTKIFPHLPFTVGFMETYID